MTASFVASQQFAVVGLAKAKPSNRPSDERPQPDWALVHRELRRPNVTLMLLWEEYCDANSDSFSYSWFCERYKEWAGRLQTWADGKAPKDLPIVDAKAKPKAGPRDVFAYVIHEGKVRAPAAAMALIENLKE